MKRLHRPACATLPRRCGAGRRDTGMAGGIRFGWLPALAILLSVTAAGHAEQGLTTLPAGIQAPDFTLTNAFGKAVTLSSELKKGPVILVFYRGAWGALRTRSLHMDLPISLGNVVGFSGGAFNTIRRRGKVSFVSVTALV